MENSRNLNLKSLSSDEINKIEEFRKSKQTAVLAILFSDIVNSTYATEKLGELTYSKLRHIHDELFKRIMCRDNAGIIIKEIGDSFLCVFAEPSTAVIRAIEFQRAIHSNKENLTIENFTLKVRIGIHVGQVAVENSLALDIFGRHVNRAARIQAIANGGQILTSQAIWENAVGWLKDNNEKNIEWLSYGKAKLKGIDERVDIYGFYPKEISKPATPNIFKKQKQKKRIFILIAFLLCVMLSFFIVEKFNQIKQDAQRTSLLKNRKSYYVQFDFSDLTNQTDTNFKVPVVDTLALKENLLSQIISVLYPDSVVTELDLMESFSKRGLIYARHIIEENNIEYFGDTLKFWGSIFINVVEKTASINDSIKLRIRLEIYPEDHVLSCSDHNYKLSLKNIENDFRNILQRALFRTSANFWTVQGRVLSCSDSIILFRLSKDAKLRTGTTLRFCRVYKDEEGLQQRLEEIKNRISYFKDKAQYSTLLKECLNEYDEKEKLSHSSYKNDWCQGVEELKGKVIELYDSTGRASWALDGIFPFEKPKAGDVLYITDY